MYTTGPEHRDTTELANLVGQLPGIKVYLGHPTIFPAEKSGQKVVGYVESGRMDDDSAVARIVITDKETLDAIQSGTHELSLGYRCKLDDQRFQREIQLDHLAVVERARCGAACSLKTDHMEIAMKLDKSAIAAALKEYLDSIEIEISEEPDTEEEAGTCPDCGKPMSECDCECPDCGQPMNAHSDACKHKKDAHLAAKARNALSSESFAVPESRKLPIPDANHVRAAMSRFNQTEFSSSEEKRTAFHKIVSKAKSLGIETKGFEAAWQGKFDACTCNNRTIAYNNGESMSDPATNTDAADLAALKLKFEQLEIEATNARKDAQVATDKVAELEKALEAAKQEAADAAVKAKSDAEESLANEVQARVDARVSLLVEAGAVLKDADLKSLSDREIKCAVIKHVDGDDVPAEKSMDYVTGVYEGALKRASKASVSRDTVRTAVNEMRSDAKPALKGSDIEKAAKEKMARESETAWMKNK